MCSVFGFLDYGKVMPHSTLTKLLRELSIAAECRGTDATGISYVKHQKMVTFKKAKPAHKVHLYFPKGTAAVIGHTRFTTQGSEKNNYNNHPFEGNVDGYSFALAHNGVLYNDRQLRHEMHLPPTRIETDSYITVQLLEQQNCVDPDALKYVAETVSGNFVFTVLRSDDTLFLVKGDNPLTILHFPKYGLYVYASTLDILTRALKNVKIAEAFEVEDADDGTIMEIDSNGNISTYPFEMPIPYFYRSGWWRYLEHDEPEDEILDDLLMVCNCFVYFQFNAKKALSLAVKDRCRLVAVLFDLIIEIIIARFAVRNIVPPVDTVTADNSAAAIAAVIVIVKALLTKTNCIILDRIISVDCFAAVVTADAVIIHAVLTQQVVHIAAYYGLRRSEVLGLRWDSIDFTNKTITIQRKVVSDYDGSGQRKLYVDNRLKTNSTRRTLPLIPHIERMLLERKELEAHFKKISGRSYDKEFEGFVCRDSFGKLIAPEYVTSRFHYVITKAGLRHLRFHDLRHSCASLLLANDVPMKAIQEWLGHSNYTITANLYSHLEYNAKVVSAETIARVLDGESLEQTKAPAETVEPAPEKKSTRKKSASKKPAAKKTADKKTASTKYTEKTTDEPAPKRAGGRKKKSDTPPATGKSQTSTL